MFQRFDTKDLSLPGRHITEYLKFSEKLKGFKGVRTTDLFKKYSETLQELYLQFKYASQLALVDNIPVGILYLQIILVMSCLCKTVLITWWVFVLIISVEFSAQICY